jgi:hypothetical protein
VTRTFFFLFDAARLLCNGASNEESVGAEGRRRTGGGFRAASEVLVRKMRMSMLGTQFDFFFFAGGKMRMSMLGTQFACFASTTVQKLTQKRNGGR